MRDHRGDGWGFSDLYSFSMLVTLGRAPGPEALEGMRHTLQKQVPSLGGNPWLFIGLVFIAAVSGGIIFKRKLRDVAQKQKELGDKGFSSDEIVVLDQMAEHHARLSAVGLVKDVAAFDAAAESYLKEIEEVGDPAERGGEIWAIREKASFSKSPDVRHYGTFALEPGQTVEAIVKRGQASRSVWMRVLKADESDLWAGGKDFVEHAQKGDEIALYVLGDGHRIKAKTRVLDVNEEEGVCHLAHSVTWENGDRRRSHRIVVEASVHYERGSDSRRATLHDLSAHGAALLQADDLEEGDEITLKVAPHRCLKKRVAEKHSTTIEVEGVVLKEREHQSGQLWPVEFREMSETDRHLLYRFVQDIEVHGIH